MNKVYIILILSTDGVTKLHEMNIIVSSGFTIDHSTQIEVNIGK